MTAATTFIIIWVMFITIVAWWLDRRIVNQEDGYDERSPWRYPSTYLFIWSLPVTAWLMLWWLLS